MQRNMLIILGLSWFISTVIIYRKTEPLRWVWHTLFYRIHIYKFRRNLKLLSKTQKTLALVEWLDKDFWFKKYWFGRKFEKIIIKELEKLQS